MSTSANNTILLQTFELIFMAIVTFVPSVNINDHDLNNMKLSNVNIMIERAYRGSYLMAIVTLAPSVTIYGIFTFELCMTLTLAFRNSQCQSNELIVGKFCNIVQHLEHRYMLIFIVELYMTVAFRKRQAQM